MPSKTPPDKLAAAVALQASGHTQEEIAATLGVSARTIGSHLRAHNARVSELLEAEAKEERARQAGQLHWILGQALRGWERSLEDSETVKVTTGGKDGGKTERTTRGQSGNPAHLNAAVGALAALRAVYRLDAAGDDPVEAEAAARGQVAGVILGALADLPAGVREAVGDRLSRALLEGAARGQRRD